MEEMERCGAGSVHGSEGFARARGRTGRTVWLIVRPPLHNKAEGKRKAEANT